MKIEMKTLVPQEQTVLKNLLYQAIYVPPGQPIPDRGIIDEPELSRYVEDWGRSDDRAVFAVYRGEVIGGAWTRIFTRDAKGYGTIDPKIPELSIAVLPKFRGKGIGTRLLQYLISNLEHDYQGVSLSVSKHNPAKMLYERFGFSTIQDKEESLIMVKYFDDAA